MKTKREIKFVLSGKEIKLLVQVREDFEKEFSRKDLTGARYEFTYSYDALYQLGFDVMGAAFFTAPRKLKPQMNRLSDKIHFLLSLSDSLSSAANNSSLRR